MATVSMQERFYKEIPGIDDIDQMQWLHAEELTALHHVARLLKCMLVTKIDV